MATNLHIHWFDESAPTTTKPLRWIWHGYLLDGAITILTSRWKSGKTTLLSVLLNKMAGGGELAGSNVAAGRAVVISEEHDQTWQMRRERLNLGAHVGLVTRPFIGVPTNQQWMDSIDELVAEHDRRPFELLVLDPLAACLPAFAENSATALLDSLMPLRRLTECGVSVLLLHHPRKNASIKSLEPRGTGAMGGFADVLMELDRVASSGPDDRRRWLRSRSRYSESVAERLIEWNEAGTDYRMINDISSLDFDEGWQVLKTVLEDSQKKLTRQGVMASWPGDHVKPHFTSLWRWLERAADEGKICRGGEGRKSAPFRYWLPSREKYFLPDLPPLSSLFEDDLLILEADARAAATIANSARRKAKRNEQEKSGK